jgi:hypothetical protein
VLSLPPVQQAVQRAQRAVPNRAQYPFDVIALLVLWRVRYKLALRDLPEMFARRGAVFSYVAVRDWETKLVGSDLQLLTRQLRLSTAASTRNVLSCPSNLLISSPLTESQEPTSRKRCVTALSTRDPSPDSHSRHQSEAECLGKYVSFGWYAWNIAEGAPIVHAPTSKALVVTPTVLGSIPKSRLVNAISLERRRPGGSRAATKVA